MIGIVQYEEKWHVRNNRRHWCARKAAVNAVLIRVGSTDRALLHGWTTRTDGPLTVVFFPPTVGKACGEEFANRANLHNHDYGKRLGKAAS